MFESSRHRTRASRNGHLTFNTDRLWPTPNLSAVLRSLSDCRWMSYAASRSSHGFLTFNANHGRCFPGKDGDGEGMEVTEGCDVTPFVFLETKHSCCSLSHHPVAIIREKVAVLLGDLSSHVFSWRAGERLWRNSSSSADESSTCRSSQGKTVMDAFVCVRSYRQHCYTGEWESTEEAMWWYISRLNAYYICKFEEWNWTLLKNSIVNYSDRVL